MDIVFKSLRIGKNGKRFLLYKFRTLKNGSDSKHFTGNESYTKFGKFLRKTKLDELPQLWNILRGEMTWVGPRPEEARTIETLPSHIREIQLSVKPGLTSLASIHFADEEKLLQEFKDPARIYWSAVKPMKFLLDVFYVQHKSFLLDLAIIWGTIRRIIIGK